MKVLAVGDIHTKLWILNSVMALIDQYDKIVFVGDYADDWMSSPQDSVNTWAALKNLQEENPDKVQLVTGNHDYIYVNKTRTLQSGYNHVTQLLINSQENKKLKLWLSSLPVTIIVDGVTYSHAGLSDHYKEDDALWQDESPLWARPPYTAYRKMPQVFGHTPSETCWEVQPDVWCIDTFSTFSSGDPIGDGTALEVVDGKKFSKIKMEAKNENNNITNSLKGRLH